MGDTRRGSGATPVGPAPTAASLLPGDLSASAGTSELLDPLLAAVAAAPEAAPPPSELEPGALIGEGFRIERRLGAGGMGVVYLAHDESLDRLVAVKLHRAGAGVDRLQREAMAMARLTHPNVITVHEVGRLGDRVFVAMEYVPGGTLRAWLKAKPRTWPQVLTVCLAAGEGLAAAHDAGLVHRDFKPENVLVGEDGRARVGDFGLARAVGDASDSMTALEVRARGSSERNPRPLVSGDGVDAQAETVQLAPRAADHEETAASPLPGTPSPVPPSSPSASASLPSQSSPPSNPATPRSGSGRGILSDRLTMTGVLIGTPAYMAPEQFAGAAVDAKADQFAFAVMVWEALHGKRPFAGSTPEKLRVSVEQGRLQQPPRDTPVPARVRAVLTRALSVAPADRWPSMHALIAALRTAAHPSRRPLLLAVAGATLLVGAGVAYAAWPRTPTDPCLSVGRDVDQLLPAPMVKRMMEIAGRGGDPELSRRVQRSLYGSVARLHGAAHATCRDARVEHRLSPELYTRAQACLALRARASALMIDDAALAGSDPVVYATRIFGLPSLVPCEDPVGLSASAPRVDAPSIVARATLWAAAADSNVERFQQAQEAVDRAMSTAAPDDRGARAMASMVQGRIAYGQDRMAEAARLLLEAYYTGVALDDTDVYLPALEMLILLHASDRFEPAEAEPWVRAGKAAIEKDARRAAAGVSSVLFALVAVADRLNQSDEAVMWAQELASVVGSDAAPHVRAEVDLALARAYASAERLQESITHYRTAIAHFTTVYGPTHPRTATVQTDYGLVLVDAQRWDEVAAVAEKARLALAVWPATRSRQRAMALLNLGALLTDSDKDRAEAERAFRDARATLQGIFGPDHPDVALCDVNLAVLENKRGNHAAAVAAIERALAIQEKAYGSEHITVGNTYYNLAASANLARDYVRAEAAARRAEAIYAARRPNSASHMFAMNRRARALSGQGHFAAALELATATEGMARVAKEGEAGIGALVEIARASIGLKQDLEQARAFLELALEQYSKFPEAYAISIADVQALLAALEKK